MFKRNFTIEKKLIDKIFVINIIILFVTIFSFASADELKNVLNKVYELGSKSAENYIDNHLTGPGDTEVSIQLKKKNKPTGSIMVIRPLKINDENLIFYQAQIKSHHVLGDNRQTINFGIGNRILSDNKSFFWGYNSFLDLDTESNTRLGLGTELKSSAFDFTGNYYLDALGGDTQVGSNTERVLDGYDLNITGLIPYLPWAKINYTHYEWKVEKNSNNIQGKIYSGELYLSNNLNLEFGYDDNNINGNRDFIRLTYFSGRKERPTIKDGTSSVAFENSDVSKNMLTKVKRNNIINLEVASSGIVIARGTN